MRKCFVCGHTVINPGITSKMLEDKGRFVIVKDVPCLVCANCGEIYFETETIRKLESILEKNISELEVISYRQVA